MKLFVYFLTVCVLIKGLHSRCGQEMTDFYQCIRSMMEDDMNQYARGIDFEQFQTMVSACFSGNGCKPIKLQRPDEILADGRVKVNPIKDPVKYVNCKRTVRDTARRTIEKCIQKIFDQDFRLPPEIRKNIAENPIPSILLEDYYPRAIYNMTQDDVICPNISDTGVKVKKCIVALYDRVTDHSCLNAFEQQVQRIQGRQKACIAGCFKKLGKCRDSYKAKLSQISECGRQLNSTTYQNMLDNCYPGLSPVTTENAVQRDLGIVGEYASLYQRPDDPCENESAYWE